jgi:hypothetical protein
VTAESRVDGGMRIRKKRLGWRVRTTWNWLEDPPGGIMEGGARRPSGWEADARGGGRRAHDTSSFCLAFTLFRSRDRDFY